MDDFENEASAKDELKQRCKNVKLFLREPLTDRLLVVGVKQASMEILGGMMHNDTAYRDRNLRRTSELGIAFGTQTLLVSVITDELEKIAFPTDP